MKTLAIAAALALLAAGAAPSLASAADTAQNNKMKVCGDEWTAMKKAGTTGKQTYGEFSKTCLAKASTPAPAPNKMAACADKWNAMKKAGTTGKQTYKEYSTTCLKS